MNGLDDARYRLRLAERYAEDAEREFDERRYNYCVGFAQEAVENSAKAIIACFGPVEKSHEPERQLKMLLQKVDVPSTVQAKIDRAWATFSGMGTATHIRATYGDEQELIPPWELIGQGEGQAALEKATVAVALAREILTEMLGPLDNG